ncbi:hypothetical protein JCM10450v2_004017 [Rhodotorula kratochvilovae]
MLLDSVIQPSILSLFSSTSTHPTLLATFSPETWRRDGLGVELPVLHFQLKHLEQTMYIDVAVVDEQDEVIILKCTVGVEVHATCRLRRIWFSDEGSPAEVDEALLGRGVMPEMALLAAAAETKEEM